jgi:hypothetical protein
MALDLKSLFGIHVHSCTHWLRPRSPPPAFGLKYEGTIGQPDRRRLFVTPGSRAVGVAKQLGLESQPDHHPHWVFDHE